jgi:hypothetical protein
MILRLFDLYTYDMRSANASHGAQLVASRSQRKLQDENRQACRQDR